MENRTEVAAALAPAVEAQAAVAVVPLPNGAPHRGPRPGVAVDRAAGDLHVSSAVIRSRADTPSVNY
ncbi:MAG: hypothetical protein GY939_03630 [Actinomycetia bacterium]|nr:hypothetical protein [Actinomycetes bacterium]